MAGRAAEVGRKTNETDILIRLDVDGSGETHISTGIPFFDHMLSLFAAHGFFDLTVKAQGDIEVDCHHTVEDVGIVLGDTLNRALNERKGICRYGHAMVPMDDALAAVTIDLSKRPYLVFNVAPPAEKGAFDTSLAKEFFRAFATHGGMNLHINLAYGENDHHILEAIFKATGRALDQAVGMDDRIVGVRSTKGTL